MRIIESIHTEVPDLPERIKALIHRAQTRDGRTFKSIAQQIGMCSNNLYRIRDGKNASISLDQLLNIEACLLDEEDYPTDWIVGKQSLLMYQSKTGAQILGQMPVYAPKSLQVS